MGALDDHAARPPGGRCGSAAPSGTSPEAISSANGLPAPTGASWSASPTSTTCVRCADRSQQRHQQLEVGHRALVHDQQIAAQRVVLVVGRALAGDPAERRVHRLGPQSRASLIRTAARPVGATSITAAPRRRPRRAIALIVAVLPVPGPPVISDRRCVKAFVDAGPLLGLSSSSRVSALGRARRVALVDAQPRGTLAHAPGRATVSSRTRSASSASSSAVARR